MGCRQTGNLPRGEVAARRTGASNLPLVESKWDLVIAIDTSSSTREPSGADIDGDGRVKEPPRRRRFSRGRRAADLGDSILAAQIQGVRALLSQLDSIPMRVGIVAYAGGNPHLRPDARVEVPLTRDRAVLEDGLSRVFENPSFDQTNLAAAIDTAAQALLHPAAGVSSVPAARLLMLLSDGVPTAPERMPRDNIFRALASAERARAAGVRIIPVDFSPSDGESSLMAALGRMEGMQPIRAPAAVLVERLGDPALLSKLLR